jgi:uncharacterized protein YfaS (alpha-2-macroglobulin family)
MAGVDCRHPNPSGGREMRTPARTAFVLIAVAALCLGAFTAAAVAAKKKDTLPVFFADSPKFNPGGEVKANGTLHTVTACKSQRVVKLQVVDANGDVITAIDEDVTKNTSGNWRLSGKLPTNLPAGTNSVRVKAKKRTAGKFVCKAGVSLSVPIP